MPKEKSAVDDFLNDLKTPNDPFKEEEVVKEDESEEVDDSEEKPLPFHKDPKVQRYVEKQIANALKDVRPSESQKFKKDIVEEINLPDSFIKLVGNDTDEKKQVLKDLSSYFGTLKGEARKEFLQEMKAQEDAQVENDRKAVEELENAFDEIEDTFKVDLTSGSSQAQKLDTDFRAYIRKIAPKDANGEIREFPDMISAFETFQEMKSKPVGSNRAKELASRGMIRSSDASGIKPSGGITWKSIDKMFS